MATTKEIMVNGIVTKVTEFDCSAQEIDDAAELAKWTSKQNLLHNWYFADPINQRGKTSYSGNSTYTVDRWGMRGDNVTVDLESDGLVINCDGASFNAIVQPIENGVTKLAGKTVTLSALIVENTNITESYLAIGNATSHIAAGTVYGEMDFTGVGLFSTTIQLPETLQNEYLTAFVCAGNPSTEGARLKIKAVKLELGNRQTLAHQDADGSWVLNDPPPDPAAELAKCQRYQYVVTSSSAYQVGFAGMITDSGGVCVINIPLPAVLAKTPTIVLDGAAFTIRDADGYVSFATHVAPGVPTSCQANYSAGNSQLGAVLTFGSNLFANNNTPCAVNLRTGKMIIDANL